MSTSASVTIMLVGLVGGMLIGFLIALGIRHRPRRARVLVAGALWLSLALTATGIVRGGLGGAGSMELFYLHMFLSGLAMFPTMVSAALPTDRRETDPP
jgi:hypothetical protein